MKYLRGANPVRGRTIGTDLVTHQVRHIFLPEREYKCEGVLQQIEILYEDDRSSYLCGRGKKEPSDAECANESNMPSQLTMSGTWAHMATHNQIKPCRDIRSAYLQIHEPIKRRADNDLIEKKASEVVVSLTHKSSEHNEEQEHLRAERRQNAISSGPASMEHTHGQGTLPMCGGLSKLRYDEWEPEGGENQLVRTVTIAVKSGNILRKLVR